MAIPTGSRPPGSEPTPEITPVEKAKKKPAIAESAQPSANKAQVAFRRVAPGQQEALPKDQLVASKGAPIGNRVHHVATRVKPMSAKENVLMEKINHAFGNSRSVRSVHELSPLLMQIDALINHRSMAPFSELHIFDAQGSFISSDFEACKSFLANPKNQFAGGFIFNKQSNSFQPFFQTNPQTQLLENMKNRIQALGAAQTQPAAVAQALHIEAPAWTQFGEALHEIALLPATFEKPKAASSQQSRTPSSPTMMRREAGAAIKEPASKEKSRAEQAPLPSKPERPKESTVRETLKEQMKHGREKHLEEKKMRSQHKREAEKRSDQKDYEEKKLKGTQ